MVSDEEAEGEAVPALVGQPPPRARLTRRELEVLRLMTHGLSARRIGETLGISPVTARNHMTAIQTKLGARNRVQAILYAAQLQLV